MSKNDKPTPEQLAEWKKSRFHKDDGTYLGSFGGNANEKEEPSEDKAEDEGKGEKK